ncbi:MAG: hypothetical protein LBV19_01710 [Streptococcaceae bacterium]|nr:hypothetical protein [Streptococcaceae bacterium]
MKKLKSIWLWPIGSLLAVILTLVIAVNLSSHSYRKAKAETTLSSNSTAKTTSSSSEKVSESSSASSPTSSSSTSSSSSPASSSSASESSSASVMDGDYYYAGISSTDYHPSLSFSISGNQLTFDGASESITLNTSSQTFSDGDSEYHYYFDNGFFSFMEDGSGGFGFGINSKTFPTTAQSVKPADGNYYYGVTQPDGSGGSLTLIVSGNTVTMSDGDYTINASNHTFSNGSSTYNYYYANGFMSYSDGDSGFGFGINDEMFNVN